MTWTLHPFSVNKAILGLGLILLIAPGILTDAYALSRQQAGLMIPLFAYPTDSSWAILIRGKQAHPSVPVIAVINVRDGPGSVMDSNFVNGIKKLQAARIIVIGYVWTNNGARSISDVESEMMRYKEWYHIDGIFFDAMNSHSSFVSYYTSLANFARSNGFVVTVGNAGSSVDQVLVGIFQVTCIYEGSGIPSVSDLTKDGGARGDFAYIAFGVPSLPSDLMTQYVSWLWVTNLSPPSELYKSLPPYFTQELCVLGGHCFRRHFRTRV